MDKPNEFYANISVRHKNGICGTILSPDKPLNSTIFVTFMSERGNILNKVPIEKLEIIR